MSTKRQLRRLLQRQGLSLDDLDGFDGRTLAGIESGRIQVTRSVARKLAKATGISTAKATRLLEEGNDE